jgi:hypothetical protein
MTFCAKVEACLPSIITLLLNCSSPSPRRVAAPNIAVSRRRLRRSATPLRTYAYPKPSDAWFEVGDGRFSSSEIQRLYEADDAEVQ